MEEAVNTRKMAKSGGAFGLRAGESREGTSYEQGAKGKADRASDE